MVNDCKKKEGRRAMSPRDMVLDEYLPSYHYAFLRTGFILCGPFTFARAAMLQCARSHPLYGACFLECADATVFEYRLCRIRIKKTRFRILDNHMRTYVVNHLALLDGTGFKESWGAVWDLSISKTSRLSFLTHKLTHRSLM